MRGRPPAPKSPQVKKTLSYARDRRDGHGENAEASRKNVPRRKAVENRSDRRAVHRDMTTPPLLEESEAALVESSARHDANRVGGWKKKPAVPLAEHLGGPLRPRG